MPNSQTALLISCRFRMPHEVRLVDDMPALDVGESGKDRIAQDAGISCLVIASESEAIQNVPAVTGLDCFGVHAPRNDAVRRLFVLGPLSFLIVHAYVLLHFVLLAGVGDFDA
jgi:hypothetical protein